MALFEYLLALFYVLFACTCVLLSLFVLLDCLFVTQIYFDWVTSLPLTEKWILLSFGVTFLIVPLIGNLIQLHNEIQVWMSDTYSKHTVQAWIRSYLRGLYMMAILFGSAFAAVDICNSNIFHLSMFNMGLNKRQRAIFKNRRVLSTVLLENFPQLIIQIVYLILTVGDHDHDESGAGNNISAITIIAMIFSIVSIITSIFDYKSSSFFIKCESVTVIEMNIKSRQLANTQARKFQKIIVHHRNPICKELAKIIRIDWRLIEITPIQTNTGAELIFHIRNNSNEIKSNKNNFELSIINRIENMIDSGKLAQVTFLLGIKMYFFFFLYGV